MILTSSATNACKGVGDGILFGSSSGVAGRHMICCPLCSDRSFIAEESRDAPAHGSVDHAKEPLRPES